MRTESLKTIARVAGVALLLTLSPVARAADDHHDRSPSDPFRLAPLRGGVYALYGRGGNVGFYVGPKCVLMIDDQFKDLAPGIKSQIEKVTDKPIKFLVNTHHHGDHVGGNEFFSQFAEVIAQDRVRAHMLESPKEILSTLPSQLDTARAELAAAPDSAKKAELQGEITQMEGRINWAKTIKIEEISPFLTFTGEMRVYLGEETIRLVHVCPAHTDGDCVVIFEKANVVHMGDCYFHRVIPLIDTAHGGSVPGYLDFIDGILGQVPADATFIPGHGEVSGIEGLKEFRGYIAALLGAVKQERAAGHTLAQAKANIQLAQYKDWQGYAGRFASNIEAAWNTVQ